MRFIKTKGFTLIEVLIALAIMSIALTALLLTTAETVRTTNRLRNKTLAHLTATQAMTLIQLELAPLQPNQEITQQIMLFGVPWFWHAKATPTSIKEIERLEITTSPNENGPFTEPLTGFRKTS